MISTDTYYPAVLSINLQDGNDLSRGSGVLLAGGKYILTAAHVIADYGNTSNISLSNLDNLNFPAIKSVTVHPDWDPTTFNNDIAIIELEQPITDIQGLDLYRETDLIGKEFIRVGYSNGEDAPQHIGTNIYDAPGSILNTPYDRSVPDGTQLLYDFDNGNEQQNMLNQLSHFSGLSSDATPTSQETIAQSGDSGGPSLIDGKVAGIASYVVADAAYDADTATASSAGETGADTNVANYIDWIDQVTETTVPEEPKSIEDVVTEVVEPDDGSCINYFLLCTEKPQERPIKLWYETLENKSTATEGKDYLGTSGWVEINQGYSCASIPVRIFGDKEPEQNESIVMQVSDPSHEWLQEGVTLIAEHTIQDNDLLFG